jgi:hypothetical protein
MTDPDSGVQRDSRTHTDTTLAGIPPVSQHVRSAKSGTVLRRSACQLTAIGCWPYTGSPVAVYGQFFMTANRVCRRRGPWSGRGSRGPRSSRRCGWSPRRSMSGGRDDDVCPFQARVRAVLNEDANARSLAVCELQRLVA